MMEQQTQHVPPPKLKGWLKAVFIVSLALNVAVLGIAGGMVLRHGHNGFPPPPGRDMGYGPLTQAMSRDDWREMGPEFMARNPDLRRGAAALGQEFDEVLAILRAENFSPEALDQALSQISKRNIARLESSGLVIGNHLKAMSAEARAAYAKRLEEVMAQAQERHKNRKEQRENRKKD